MQQGSEDLLRSLRMSQVTCTDIQKTGGRSEYTEGKTIQQRRGEVSFIDIGLNGKFLRFRRVGPFLKRLVTCDEKWIFYDNVIRNRQW
jgi:hypothetical protein